MRRYLLLVFVLIASSVHAKKADDGSQIQPDNYYPQVKLETSMGDILVELDRRRAPITVNNFLRYIDKRQYENTVFHRIIEGFVVQGGGYDPDYNGLPNFPEIYNESGNGLKNELYTIAMARQNGPHTATRQFFFNMNDNESLDPGKEWGYAVFGSVLEGTEVLEKMSQVETQYRALLGIPNSPVENIILKKITILPPI